MADYNIDSHYSSETKIIKPKRQVAFAPANLPTTHVYSDKDARQKMAAIDYDIYQGTIKEKKKHEFDKSFFIKIFCGITLLTLLGIFAGKIRGFFRKS